MLNLGSRDTASGASMRIKLLRDSRNELRLLQLLRFQSKIISIINHCHSHRFRESHRILNARHVLHAPKRDAHDQRHAAEGNKCWYEEPLW